MNEIATHDRIDRDRDHPEIASPSLPVPDGRSHPRHARRRLRHRHQERDLQRAAVSRAFSGQPGISRRADDRGHGADRRRDLHALDRLRKAEGAVVYFLTIDKAKFRKPVIPGDTIEYHMTKIAQAQEPCGGIRGEAKVAGEVVAEAEVGAMIATRKPDGIDRSTARVAAGAAIGAGAVIGPYCVIGPDVVIGEGCRLVAHVHVTGHTTIGPRTVVYPFASLGTPPQSCQISWRPDAGSPSDADCDIRENVTINTRHRGRSRHHRDRRPLFSDGGSHVAHDCKVGNHVTFANNAVHRRPCQRRR